MPPNDEPSVVELLKKIPPFFSMAYAAVGFAGWYLWIAPLYEYGLSRFLVPALATFAQVQLYMAMVGENAAETFYDRPEGARLEGPTGIFLLALAESALPFLGLVFVCEDSMFRMREEFAIVGFPLVYAILLYLLHHVLAKGYRFLTRHAGTA